MRIIKAIFFFVLIAFADSCDECFQEQKKLGRSMDGIPLSVNESYKNSRYINSVAPIDKGMSSSGKLLEFLSQFNDSRDLPISLDETEHIYSKPRKFKRGMSKLERSALKSFIYQKQLEKIRKEPEVNLFDQLHEWNKKKGYTLSSGTCDRRGLKICKNSCMRTYHRICQEYKCRSSFKEHLRRNCYRICKVEFKKEFRNIF